MEEAMAARGSTASRGRPPVEQRIAGLEKQLDTLRANFESHGMKSIIEDLQEKNRELEKQLAEKNIEIARSVADTLKIFNYEGTSGGIARFTINGVPFSADVYDNSVGPLGAQRLDALHKVMANRAEAEGAKHE
jgi:hypothetical protein